MTKTIAILKAFREPAFGALLCLIALWLLGQIERRVVIDWGLAIVIYAVALDGVIALLKRKIKAPET